MSCVLSELTSSQEHLKYVFNKIIYIWVSNAQTGKLYEAMISVFSYAIYHTVIRCEQWVKVQLIAVQQRRVPVVLLLSPIFNLVLCPSGSEEVCGFLDSSEFTSEEAVGSNLLFFALYSSAPKQYFSERQPKVYYVITPSYV